MDIPAIIVSQYLATLEMLRQAVVKCPEILWNDCNYDNVFWSVVYHVLFYLHIFLSPGWQQIRLWAKHREGYERLMHDVEPYSREEMLEYVEVVRYQIEKQVREAPLEAPSGWGPSNRLEFHIYNIRHAQQHVGELYERLGTAYGTELDWVASGDELSAQ